MQASMAIAKPRLMSIGAKALQASSIHESKSEPQVSPAAPTVALALDAIPDITPTPANQQSNYNPMKDIIVKGFPQVLAISKY